MLKKARVPVTIAADASRLLKEDAFKGKIILSSTKDPLYGQKSDIFRAHLQEIADSLKPGEKKLLNVSKEAETAGLGRGFFGRAHKIVNETEFKNLFIVQSTEERSIPMIKRIATELATDPDLTHYA